MYQPRVAANPCGRVIAALFAHITPAKGPKEGSLSTLFWAALWTLALIIDNSETFASYPADATGYCVDITLKHAAPSAQGRSDGLANLDGRTKAARRAHRTRRQFRARTG
jgi:hypothetical protein